MCKTFVILIALVCSAWPSPVRADIVETSYSCVVHVHSNTSGDDYYSLPELADVARENARQDDIVHGPAPLRLVSNPIFVLRIGL